LNFDGLALLGPKLYLLSTARGALYDAEAVLMPSMSPVMRLENLATPSGLVADASVLYWIEGAGSADAIVSFVP
jgi:hypothetical protein